MFRYLLILSLVIWLMPPAFAKAELALNLDDSVNVQLLPHSHYYLDTDESYDFSSIDDLDGQKWTPFNREQFKLGLTSGYVWVKTTLRTTGNSGREVAIKLHSSMDKQQIKLSTRGEEPQQFSFGLGSEPDHYHYHEDDHMQMESHHATKIKSDHVIVRLSPNKTYFLYLRSDSDNPVIGDFKILDHEKYVSDGKFVESWLYIYLVLAMLIILYCSGIFILSHDRAYLSYMGYVVSTIVYLLADSGALSLWFHLHDLGLIQKLIMLGLTGFMLFVLLLIKQMHSGFNQFSVFIRRLHGVIFIAAFSTLLVSIFLSYEIALRLYIFVVIISMPIAAYILIDAYLKEAKQFWEADYRTLTLRIILLTFMPLAFVHLITRMGFISANLLTNHVLFLAVFIEIFLVSGILLLNLKTSKRAFTNQEVTNSQSLLPNDIALERQLQKSTFSTPVSLLQIWISGFDGLQTTLGTRVFCEFLQSFGTEAQEQLNKTTFLSDTHTGLDTERSLFHSDQSTFILLCRQLNREDQNTILEMIESSVNKAIDQFHEHFDFKVSIGAYVFDNAQQEFEITIQNSVLALSEGIKNDTPFTYYTEHIGFNEARRNQLINDFYPSLADGKFFLLWQPQYDTKLEIISGVEVLARWNHPELGMIGPDEFIPLLEQSHRISDLTKWVINKVFDELPLLHKSSGEVEVSINLSTRDLSNSDLIEMLDLKLETHKDLVPFITMEITESMMIDDYQVVLSNVNKLQDRGFKVSIDDFGSGYASFAYLQSLPANELKIDRCYTDRFEEPRTSAILESVIELAKSLNMIIVVEGVESTQQVERFTKLGVDRLQGWAMGKPMSLDDLILRTS